MNSLSWMIYAAGVLENIQGVFIGAAICASIGVFAFMMISAMNADMGQVQPGTWTKGLKWVWLPAFLALTAALIPSASTVYLMAASEAGEAVVTSPDAKDMLNDLKSIIRKKLKEELGGAEQTGA